MNKAIKKKWVAALRSGKYKQTSNVLRKNDDKGNASFCCLGVLCNLHAQAHPKIAAMETDPGYYMGKRAELPDEVVEWAGLNGRCGATVSINRAHIWLTAHNDNGRTFDQIADAIEAQL